MASNIMVRRHVLVGAAVVLGLAALSGQASAQLVKLGGLSVGSGGVSLGGTNLVSLGSGSGGLSIGSGSGGISLGSGAGGISLGGGDLGLAGITLGSDAGGSLAANVGDVVSASLDPSSPSGQLSIGLPSFGGDNFLSGAVSFGGQGDLPGDAQASVDVGVPNIGLLGGVLDGIGSLRVALSTPGVGGGGGTGGTDTGNGGGVIGTSGGGGGGGVAIGGFSASYADNETRITCAQVLRSPRLFAAKVVRACGLAHNRRQHSSARRSAAR